jgi:uncharacterized SAM-binding protein YcdF (DUF218 family)
MTDEEITQLLFVSADPVPADLAMVFGAANQVDLARRTARGVELYRTGHVPRLLVTGGGVLAHREPGAKRMRELALELGVPPAALLVEDRSCNTFENAEFSAQLLRDAELLDGLKTVLLVSSEWHMRRVLLTVRRFFPPWVRFVCCPTREGRNRDNWTASPAGREEVLQEATLLTGFLQSAALDWEPD